MTIRQLTELWRSNSLGQKSADYIKTVDSLLQLHVLPQLGDMVVTQLTPIRISAWVSILSRTPAKNKQTPLSQRTVRHCYTTLSTVFSWAVTYEIIDRSPFDKTEAPKVRKHKPAYLDDDQAVELLRQLAKEDDMSFRCAVLLALMAGLRLGEVDALTWSDINWKRGTIDITKAVHQTPETGRVIGDPKTDEALRLITAPAALLTLLDETRKAQQEAKQALGNRYRDHNLIVCSWDGSPLNKDTPSKQWRRFAKAHGFDGVTFHNLRTTHATLLLSNNIDAVAVAGRMGHTDATTTLRFYAGLVAQRDRDSAAVMDSIAQRAGMTANTMLPPIKSVTQTTGDDYTITQITLEKCTTNCTTTKK